MKTSNLLAALLMISLPLTACSKDDEAKDDKAEASAKPDKKDKADKKNKDKEGKSKEAKGKSLAPDTPSTKLGELPVASDLEEEAHKTVALENMEAELDRLEAEIAGPG